MNANDKEQARADFAEARAKLNSDHIVLIDDFFAFAVAPALQNNPAFEKIFGPDGEKIRMRWQKAIRGSSAVSYRLGYFQLVDQAKDRADAKVGAKADALFDAELEKLRGRAHHVVISAHPQDQIPSEELIRIFESNRDDVISKKIREVRNEYYEYATSLEDVIRAMEACRGFLGDGGVFRFDNQSMDSGEVQSALNFWDAVHDLHDYTGRINKFLDPKDPPGRGPLIPIGLRPKIRLPNWGSPAPAGAAPA